jgi:adenylate kinase family enzyme
VPEAELVIDSLKWLGRPFTILNIAVSDEEVKRRLVLRKEIEGRADDSVVDERLKEYKMYTEAAIEKFRESGSLIEVNGEQTPEAIAEDIVKALNL